MKDRIHIHRVLGISDDRQQEISADIFDTITKAKFMDEGIKTLTEKYDPESILAGMRLGAIVQMNNNAGKVRRTLQSTQNAPMN